MFFLYEYSKEALTAEELKWELGKYLSDALSVKKANDAVTKLAGHDAAVSCAARRYLYTFRFARGGGGGGGGGSGVAAAAAKLAAAAAAKLVALAATAVAVVTTMMMTTMTTTQVAYTKMVPRRVRR